MNNVILFIGYWCLCMGWFHTGYGIIAAIKIKLTSEYHIAIALYFLVAVYCLK